MTSHLGVMLLFAGCVAVVFATLLREDATEQRRVGGKIFAALVGGAFVLGWLMFLLF